MRRSGNEDSSLMRWLPRPPDFHAMCFFHVVINQRKSILSSYTPNAARIKTLDNRAVQSINQEMLQHVWAEFELCLDICIVSNGAHMENFNENIVNVLFKVN